MNNLSEDIKQLIRDAANELRQIKGPLPKELFHYCSSNSLYEILKNGKFWASDVFCMNDTSEIDCAIDLMKDVLDQRKDESNMYLRSWVPLLREKFREEWSNHAFCFSAAGDLLSQWRAYGSSGHGFAIGFDLEKLLSENNDFLLQEMEYCADVQTKRINQFLDSCINIRSQVEHEFADSFWLDVLATSARFLYNFKREQFSEEREWRAFEICFEDQWKEKLKFRPIRGAVVPYIEIPFPPEWVTAVIRGPSLDDSFDYALRRFLSCYGYYSVRLDRSKIPLRELTT